MPLIGIDLGTTFIKGAVLDLDRMTIEHVRRIPFPEPLAGLPPLYREFDPLAVVRIVRGLLRDLLAVAPCEGIVMCTQMHGLVFTTPEGEPRSNLMTWQDQRVLMPHPSGRGSYFEVMVGRLTPAQRRLLGNELRVGLPVGTLFWMAERGELPTRDLIPAALPDFVLATLCGAAPTTDPTNAQAHGALNLETLDWYSEVIDALNLGSVRWPPIRPSGAVVGHLPIEGRRIACYTPVGDYQCALAGALLRAGELSVNISTGSQVSLLRDRLELGNGPTFQTRPFFDGRFLITVTTIPAGRALNALLGLLTELSAAQGVALADPWEYIAHAAAQVQAVEMRINLSFYSSAVGERGEIANIRESELTVGHVFRAAFENMAENYFTCALRLSPEQEWTNLVFSGGLSRKIGALRDLVSQRFGKPHRSCPTAEDTMLGLMALGMAFTHRTPTVAQAMAALYERFQPADE